METLFENLDKLIELIPIAIIGLLVGGVSYFTETDKNDEDADNVKDSSLKDALKHTIYALAVCVIVYACLDATDLPYIARVGIASAASFFGLDNVIKICQDLISFRSGRNGR